MARGGGGGSRGGGFGGGGRSFGGGGGRSFGGRSGGGSHNRGSMGRGMGGLGGGFGGRPAGGRPASSRPTGGIGGGIFGSGMSSGRSSRPRYGGGGGGYGGGNPGCGSGCLVSLIMMIVVAIVLIAVAIFIFGSYIPAGSGGSSSAVTASTVQREKLPAGSVVETDYYTDDLGWIKNQSKLLSGMKNFYQQTGVQPHLYITDSIMGSHQPSGTMAEEFANQVYNSLFQDEAHFLLIFFEYQEQYTMWYLAGSQGKTVMDAEATDILLDYVERYYYDDSLSDEEFFSKAFNDAGERIMQVTTSPWIPVLIVLFVLVILIIAFIWWNNHKKHQKQEAERTERMLNTPLTTFGSKEAEDLADKYK